jgi:hypothetical protein
VAARRVIVVIIVAICLGVPVVEAFDRWDNTLQDGYDTEATVVIVALCVGLALTVAAAVAQWILPLRWRASTSGFSTHRPDLICAALPAPAPTGSPPTPLRV